MNSPSLKVIHTAFVYQIEPANIIEECLSAIQAALTEPGTIEKIVVEPTQVTVTMIRKYEVP